MQSEHPHLDSASRTRAAADPSFESFLRVFEDGLSGFVDGDKRLWMANASKAADVTVMGGWGAVEKGWSEVGPRYDWAAARFIPSGAEVQVEYLAKGASGALAFSVSIERSRSQVQGQTQPALLELRVTHLYRRENGHWKMIHRHAIL
jgi:ketosteroid isomerase-like protein